MLESRCLAGDVERLGSSFASAVEMLKVDATSEGGKAICALAEQSGQCALWILPWDGAAGCWPENLSSDISLVSPLVQNAARIAGLVVERAKTMFGNNELHSIAHIASSAMNLLLNDIFLCICIFYQLSCKLKPVG